jgi:hypothetical protein
MISLIDLEKSVANLTTEELNVFRAWFWQFDNQVWNNKLEQDIQMGKLDVIAEQAIATGGHGVTRTVCS